MLPVYLVILIVSTTFLSLVAVVSFMAWQKREKMLDVPNERSNHTVATPKGGGLPVMVAALSFLAVAGANMGAVTAAALLVAVSLFDDARGLPARTRLIFQVIAVIYALPAVHGSISGGLLPYWLEIPIIMVFWVWFTNLYNFMDGIDGITSVETVSIAFGLTALSFSGAVPAAFMVDGWIVAAAVLGFAWFNWYPARLFLGDVGSIPLGFLMGFLMLQVAAHGHQAAALILPAYYLADATFVLMTRFLRKEKIWEAHSEHFYQRAVRRGWRHDEVAQYVGGLNVLLMVVAVFSTINGVCAVIGLALGYGLAGGLMFYFAHKMPFKQRQAADAR